ncbi:FAD-dependent monooxygenase [Micromonospora sp. WMMD1082]|uniref:FAD-dependent monooxygenase n=1 Tax=Micromonospora sp. WMMD1082 TaxID=3016104 RepID=UPI0024169088|nr:FAD-dependent monooxygenase [Micromonospora sp. WMMD1082]MDG4798339.1 FAD-dependent monooxygenase [Micromonospora sp. WMMD1082]
MNTPTSPVPTGATVAGATDRPRVAVVGAGMGGLTLAILLARLPCIVDVYEQAPAFARVGAGINVSPNATRALDGAGVLTEMRRTACRPAGWTSRSWDTGDVLAYLPLGDEAEKRYHGPFLQMHRGDFHQALVEAAAATGGVNLHHGHRLVGLDQSAGDAVRLTFADGRTAEADLVIGADGIHSQVRRTVMGESELHFTGRVAYRGVVEMDRGQRDVDDDFVKWWGPDRHIVAYYIGAGREVYYVTSIPETSWREESWSTRGSLDDLREAMDGFHSDVHKVINMPHATYKWALYDRQPLATWHDGAVTLLGDACHPMVPYMAQGAAMAVEDAVVLYRSLTRHGFGDLPRALDAYEGTRLARTAQVQTESAQNTFMRSGGSPQWLYGYDAWSVPLTPADSEVSR